MAFNGDFRKRGHISHWKQTFKVEDCSGFLRFILCWPETIEAGDFITLSICFVIEEGKNL